MINETYTIPFSAFPLISHALHDRIMKVHEERTRVQRDVLRREIATLAMQNRKLRTELDTLMLAMVDLADRGGK